MKKLLPFVFATAIIACSSQVKEKETEAKVAEEIQETTKSNAEKKLEKYVKVKLTTDVSKLTENQRKMIPILIEVAEIMDDLFWKQAYGDKVSFLEGIQDEATKQFAEINYGPWDRLAGNKPFVECCSHVHC